MTLERRVRLSRLLNIGYTEVWFCGNVTLLSIIRAPAPGRMWVFSLPVQEADVGLRAWWPPGVDASFLLP